MIGGATVADEDLQQFVDVQVEESAQEADAVTLSARIEPGSDGEW